MRSICRAWSANRRSELILLLCGAAAACLGGCASVGAKPWEHDLLAERAMRVDSYPLQSAMDDHIYFSKEASTGGRSYAGGGCGCN
ncbi:MAG: hypothetical protein JWN85_914 [Gammaproteobacteria bacterium]|nr:hypothetical protein [Gammaproteobacteria bacterium]